MITEESERVFDALAIELPPCLLHTISEMWGQHCVGSLPQRMILRQRFTIIDVESCHDSTCFQSFNQRNFIHNGAAGGIDQDCSRLHRSEFGCADQPMCSW